MASVCSVKKMDYLLKEIHSGSTSSVGWQKVVSWTKSVMATLRRLETEFSTYSDIVAPFTAGLTLVRSY